MKPPDIKDLSQLRKETTQGQRPTMTALENPPGPPRMSPGPPAAGETNGVRRHAESRGRASQRPANGWRRFAARALFGLCGILMLSACVGATPPAPGPAPKEVLGLPAPEDGQARIVFYRPRGSLFPALTPDVVVNGRKVGVSVAGDLFLREAHPGRYEVFLSNDRDKVLSLTVAAGEVAYVRTSVAFGFIGPYLKPKLVEEETARQEIANLAPDAPATGS